MNTGRLNAENISLEIGIILFHRATLLSSRLIISRLGRDETDGRMAAETKTIVPAASEFRSTGGIRNEIRANAGERRVDSPTEYH